MKFFKKLFSDRSSKSSEEQNELKPVNSSLDDSFVERFIQKGGKFLYATEKQEIVTYLKHILIENNWKEIVCINPKLYSYLKNIKVNTQADIHYSSPFFTTCEHLISDTGSILFSSNQLKSEKISTLSKHFIVYATTSQLVKNIGQGLTGIKANFKSDIPTNISSIKNYSFQKNHENFMNYESNNSKNLYLLLFEDL